jgi:hypothetical protein
VSDESLPHGFTGMVGFGGSYSINYPLKHDPLGRAG